MRPAPYRIQKARKETADTFTLELAPAGGEAAPPFAPGQFNMLYVFGVGEVPISISGDPASRGKIEHTTRVVGAVTRAMGRLQKGGTIGVRGPFGSRWPVDEAAGQDVVIITGGVGLAPLRPVLYALTAQRKSFGRIVLLYGARTPQDILYARELERWRGKFDLEIHVTVDRVTGDWMGNVGVVTQLIPRAPFHPPNSVALVCGPEVMMRFAIVELEKRGVTAERTYISMERNMKCAVGFCGHCQFGPTFTCKDGPVFRLDRVADIIGRSEV